MTDSTIERNPVLGMTLMVQQDLTDWQLIGVFPESGPPSGRPTCRLVRDGGNSKIFQWQGLPLRLQQDQSDDYIYNLTSRTPMLFVICKPGADEQPVPLRISADQDDCVAAVEHDELVFQAPMPSPIAQWIQRYVEAHWAPGPRKNKRGRDRRPDDGGKKSS